jgi:hypothetical protein
MLVQNAKATMLEIADQTGRGTKSKIR